MGGRYCLLCIHPLVSPWQPLLVYSRISFTLLAAQPELSCLVNLSSLLSFRKQTNSTIINRRCLVSYNLVQDLINCALSQIPIRYQVLYSVADVASFQAFFNYSDMRMLLENFSVYHVNAPGQEEAAQPLPDELVFALLILLYKMGNVQRIFWNRS